MEIEGIPLYCYGRVSSTMDVAEEFVRKGMTGIITAEEQESGRGRYGREWFSPPGGLYFSFILNAEGGFPLSEIVSLSIVKTLESFGISCNINLPNDIITERKKIAGILIVKKEDVYITGIGINVNNDVGDTAERISVRQVLNRRVEKKEVLEQFVKTFLIQKKQFTEDLQASLKNWSEYLIK